MSTATFAPAAGVLDIAGTRGIPTTRLIGVELRKLVDTRASRWLLATIALVTAGIVAIVFFVAPDDSRVFLTFMGATATPQGFLLPVLGILLVTSEWGQRTALVTFTMEPHRGKVIAAKVAAALIAGAAAIVLALGVAALATVLAGAPEAWENIGPDDVAKFALLQASGVLQGLMFGLLFLNSAAAIVTYFVLPIAFSVVANVWSLLRERAAWIDLSTAQSPLFTGVDLTDRQWAQLAVTSAIWIALPFLVGLVRVLRAEVK